jgi:hypothetical protein
MRFPRASIRKSGDLDEYVRRNVSSMLLKNGTMYGMHAVQILRHTCTCDRIAGSHNLKSGLFCGVIGWSQTKRTSEAAATRARGVKQATTATLRENRIRRYTTRLKLIMIIETSVDMSIMQ